VKTDHPLKELFRRRPGNLLALTGDAGAELESTGVVELAGVRRTVDTVLWLRRGRQRYIRHLEFEVQNRTSLAFRCFEYSTRLVARYQIPVLTTVVFVGKSAPAELSYREVLGGRVVHERRFDVVCLRELDPRRALEMGPGGAALVGRSDKVSLAHVGEAARLIQRETEGGEQSDLLFILQTLCGGRYTAKELAGVVPRETVMASSLWAEVARKGREEGAIREARAFCAALVREHHPQIADRMAPVIEACADVARLHEWGLQSTRVSDAELERLVTENVDSPPAGSRTGRGRTPRPSRRAKASRSR